MIKSRLQTRRNTKTVAVKVKTLTSGTDIPYTEATVSGLSAVVATFEQGDPIEISTDAGTIIIVPTTFWFEALAGSSLPAIEEKHVLVDTDSVRYEVLAINDQGGGDDRLEVITRRLR